MIQSKYKIIRSILRYENGTKDRLNQAFETNDLKAEKERLKEEHGCKSVEFWFVDMSIKSQHKVKHGA